MEGVDVVELGGHLEVSGDRQPESDPKLCPTGCVMELVTYPLLGNEEVSVSP